MRTSHAQMKLPQTTHREPQGPRRPFFSTKTASEWPKTTKKCAEGAHAPCPHETTSNNRQKASGIPAHFLIGPKRPQNGQKRPKTVKIRIILRYFALFLAQKSARRVRTPRPHLQLPQTNHRKPQEPRHTFFSAKNGLKMAKNDQKPLKYALF